VQKNLKLMRRCTQIASHFAPGILFVSALNAAALSNMWAGRKDDNRRLPLVLAGGMGGKLQPGRTLNYQVGPLRRLRQSPS